MKKNKTGPKADNLKIEGDWVEAMGKAVKKERPTDGWPTSDKDSDKGKKDEK